VFQHAYGKLQLPALDIAGTPTGFGTEVMNALTNAYSIVVTADGAAAELGVSREQLIAALQGSPRLGARLSSLLSPAGVVRRDTWEASYRELRGLLFPQP
jgi:hypothetical protein